MTPDTPILQFGTSRFLLAHADLFVSQALDKGEALGRIAIIQTTGNAESLKRVAALNSRAPYPCVFAASAMGRKWTRKFRAGPSRGR